ncbi:MAG: hypothetical protein QG637_1365, partial [Chloroflexota bacterium]|nr:hypothetical protein [Chloroflexota bacterium]
MKRAETLSEIRQATDVGPLDGEAIKEFYVLADPARDPLLPPSGVLRDLLYETPPPLRLLFASHPGAGKSTELNRLMIEAQADFWFVRLPTPQMLDIATLTHVDLILAMMETLYAVGRKESLIKDRRVIEPVRGWLREVVRETKIVRDEELEAEAGAGLDGLLAQIVGLQAKLRGAFSLSHESAKIVRQALQPRIAELRQYCNQVLVEIANHLNRRHPQRRLVLVVEGTDKLDIPVARELFVEHTGLLADLQASIIYTVPLFLIHSADRKRLESYFETLTLPMIKTHTPPGAQFELGWQVLREIVGRRLDTERLISSEALNLAIEKTGGVLRDLLWAIQLASQVARYENVEQISAVAMRHSLDQLKKRYSQSVYSNTGRVDTAALYAKMTEIAQAPLGKAPMDEALQLLLYTQAVIEYNATGWYDLHPLMREALQEMG